MVLPRDTNRGELYPILTTGDVAFTKYFGLGVGMYFFDLKVLTIFFFICGLIMIPALIAYDTSYDDSRRNSNSNTSRSDSIGAWSFSAHCNDPIEVTATLGCDSSSIIIGDIDRSTTTCIGYYRDNCPFPSIAVVMDVVMCVMFLLLNVIASNFGEYFEDKVDDSIQTAKDYAVVVINPPTDADNMHDWYEFFSTYGDVRYITIHRANAVLVDAMTKTHVLEKKLLELSKLDSVGSGNLQDAIRYSVDVDNEGDRC